MMNKRNEQTWEEKHSGLLLTIAVGSVIFAATIGAWVLMTSLGIV